MLDLSGRTEEALAEVRAGLAVVRAQPERTTYDTFLEIQGVNHLIRLGRFDELEPRAAGAAFGDDGRHDAALPAQLRARIALLPATSPRAVRARRAAAAAHRHAATRSGSSRCSG